MAAVGLHYPCSADEKLVETLAVHPQTRFWASEECLTGSKDELRCVGMPSNWVEKKRENAINKDVKIRYYDIQWLLGPRRC